MPSHEPGLSQDDDLVPWLNQPLDESLQTGYGSDFFRDVSEVTVNEQENEVTEQTVFPFFHTRNNSNQSLANSVRDESRHGRGTSQSSSSQSNLFQGPPPLCQNDRVKNIAAGHNTVCEESGRLSQKQVPVLPSNKPALVNFSHFLWPAALTKSNRHGMGVTSTREMGSTSSAAGTSGSNHVETRLPVSDNRLRKENTSRSPTKVLQTKIVSAKVQEDKVFNQSVASDPAKFVTVSSSSKDNEKGCQIPGNSCRRDQHSEKAMEPVVQCSSVCSGNSMEGPPDGPSRSLKRLHSDIQDMDYHSEDDEEELTDGGKVRFRVGSGSKRSRSAEVHNLSERRRRDRINEKMRALQELIPNCNKVDKASMLEEAIEHIKSLQLHIQNYQMMSMSSGYYMPPMMFPPGMQPMHAAAHVPPHYAAMAMGMGMNYGMGMPDMSCVSPRVPMVQVPPQFQATGVQPFVRPGIVMPPVPGGFFMGSPREINAFAVTETETNKDADQTKETGSMDQEKNKTLKPTQSSSCSNLPTKQVSDQVRGSS